MFSVYLLRSLKSNKSYVGVTSKDIRERLTEHNLGSNEWSRNHRPFKLIYYETFYCEKDALHREKFLKSGIGNNLVKLILKEFNIGA